MNISAMTEREAVKQDFLRKAGWGNAVRQSLGQDASTRSYERLTLGSQTAIFMDAPPAHESAPCGPEADEHERVMCGWNARTRLAACRVDAFVGIAGHLQSIGISAPKVFAYDVEDGLAVLEDLGDGIFAREIENGADELTLYLAATDALAAVHLAETPSEVRAGQYHWPILDYDRLALTTAADLFSKWYPAYDDSVRFPGNHARDYADLCAEFSDYLAGLPGVFMMRDYHAENLLWLPDRTGKASVGVLDFQDAVRGPAAWDVAMFVQDARRDVSPEVAEAVVHRYCEVTGYARDDFLKDLAIAGAINALRILGLFARLIHRDKKPRYQAFMDREWGHLEDCLHHPALADLKWILSEAVPNREGLKR